MEYRTSSYICVFIHFENFLKNSIKTNPFYVLFKTILTPAREMFGSPFLLSMCMFAVPRFTKCYVVENVIKLRFEKILIVIPLYFLFSKGVYIILLGMFIYFDAYFISFFISSSKFSLTA